MKLFQIEEPDGAPVDRDAPGAAVGIDLAARAVAVAVGGNAELLPVDEDEAAGAVPLLLALRSRAEKQLARPVTHAVIATDAPDRAAIEAAAAAAEIAVLKIVTRAEAAAGARGADPALGPVLGAAVLAEDLAPPAET